MKYTMNLVPSAFNAIAKGHKTVEMRLCDERRSIICIGDDIEFENIETHRKILCKVISLARFQDFFALYASFDKTALGYGEYEVANPEDMYQYYSPEMVAKYGALAIEIKLI